METSSVAAVAEEGCSAEDVSSFRQSIDNLVSKTDEVQHKVNEVVQFYASKKNTSNSKGCSASKEKENTNANFSGSGAKKQADGGQKDPVCTKRMQELMRQFGTILKQMSQHKWSWPFMQPVDVEGLGLDDYYEVDCGA